MKTKATIIVFLALNLCAIMNLVKCKDDVPSTFDPSTTKRETCVTIEDIARQYRTSELQPSFDDVLSHFKQMVAKYDEIDPKVNSFNVELLSAMVNQLNIITTALMNSLRTYKGMFDAINRVTPGHQ